MSDPEKDVSCGPLDLWNSVCETPAEFTKQVNQRGGFTAICAHWQRRCATEIWGPYGDQWGMDDIVAQLVGETLQGGAPKSLVMKGVFRYPGGKFEVWGDHKWKDGDDCYKKLQTDITTKALSMLGFNADVFLGLYDDAKYVSAQKKKSTRKKAGGSAVNKETTEDLASRLNAVRGWAGLESLAAEIKASAKAGDLTKTTLEALKVSLTAHRVKFLETELGKAKLMERADLLADRGRNTAGIPADEREKLGKAYLVAKERIEGANA